ncbi:MAG: LysR substrate-binding domain-containing protein [Janthinobacterium lividum]
MHKPQVVPPFAALRAFESFGRFKSMRKAAAHLSLHHAVVSRHINALEEWIGVPLLDRKNRDRCLTIEGEKFHARIAAAIADLADATIEVMRAAEDGNLTVWSNGGLAAKWLGSQLVQFNSVNHTLSIELRPTDTPPDFSRREADVDIRYYGDSRYYRDSFAAIPERKGVRHEELLRPEIFVVGAPRLVAKLQGQPAEALLEATLLHEERDEQWRAWFRAHDVATPDVIPGAKLWHAHIALEAAVNAKGFALASKLLVREELRDGHLTVLTPHSLPRPPTLGAYYFFAREDRWNAPAVTKLRQWLRRQAETTLD